MTVKARRINEIEENVRLSSESEDVKERVGVRMRHVGEDQEGMTKMHLSYTAKTETSRRNSFKSS